MSIYWQLDEEDGIDVNDLLGDIFLEDSYGKRIEESCTYLDSYLLALAEGYVAVASGGQMRIEVFDAPISILFTKVEDYLTIEYNGQSVCFRFNDAVRDLIDSYSKLAYYTGYSTVIPKYVDLNEAIALLSERL